MVNRRRQPSTGYTLVGLLVIFTVMSIVVAAALPMWSQAVQRDREEELIFRGLQYAEAIRVFQLRNGRFPVRLDELADVRPRCIRRLWRDPMTKEGQWGLILAQGAPDRQGRVGEVAPDQQSAGTIGGSGPRPLGGEAAARETRRGSSRTVAAIIGVHSLSDDKPIKDFFDGQKYSDWRFSAQILPMPAVAPDTLTISRAHSGWVGRPFPAGLEPLEGEGPEDAFEDDDDDAARARSVRRRGARTDG